MPGRRQRAHILTCALRSAILVIYIENSFRQRNPHFIRDRSSTSKIFETVADVSNSIIKCVFGFSINLLCHSSATLQYTRYSVRYLLYT